MDAVSLANFHHPRDCWADPKRTYALPPGEHGLFKVIDSFANSSVEGYPSELKQYCSRWRVNEIARQRNLDDGAVAFWDHDKARRVFALQLGESNSIGVRHFVSRRVEFNHATTPNNNGGDDVARTCWVIVEQAKDR